MVSDYKIEEFTLSPDGARRAVQAGGTMAPAEAELKSREATRRAYTIISELAELRKQKPPAFAIFSSPSKKLLAEFSALLHAKPCWVDLDARHKYQTVGGRYTLLHQAAESGVIDVITLLLDAGANINSVSDRGTALRLAIGQHHEEITRLLLSKGADPNRSKPDALEAAHFNISNESLPIFQAASGNLGNAVVSLVGHGANPNEYDPHWRKYVLTETTFGSNLRAAKALIDCDANPNLHTEHGSATALAEAGRGGSIDYITLLLDAGSDLTIPNAGRNAMTESAFWNKQGRDEEKNARRNCFSTRFNEAQACYASWSQRLTEAQNPAQEIRKISARDVIYHANIGKLDLLLEQPAWNAAKDHLQQLLVQLPPWMTGHIAKTQPTLLIASAPIASGWSDRISSGACTQISR